eukprot:2130945-Alexandrium_andersonii.AAC.1
MSASLVGSEMCIRDRWGPAADIDDAGCEASKLSVAFHGAACLHMNELESVSYTHLTLPTICSV